MRIVALSDTHTLHWDLKVPDADILVHCGDFTNVGSVKDVAAFNMWLGSLPHTHKLVVPGNHDFLFETHPDFAKSLLSNATLLLDSEIIIDGVKFYGSPYTPWFNDWAFGLRTSEDRKRKWSIIPNDVDVLITHGPAFGVRDYLPGTGNIGDMELREALERINPKVHLCGHIHAGHGSHLFGNIQVYNCAICDEKYEPVNPVTVFEMEK